MTFVKAMKSFDRVKKRPTAMKVNCGLTLQFERLKAFSKFKKWNHFFYSTIDNVLHLTSVVSRFSLQISLLSKARAKNCRMKNIAQIEFVKTLINIHRVSCCTSNFYFHQNVTINFIIKTFQNRHNYRLKPI